ncbi:MAG: hypothetical protein ACHQYP_04945 [Nitrospiria bacterium]
MSNNQLRERKDSADGKAVVVFDFRAPSAREGGCQQQTEPRGVNVVTGEFKIMDRPLEMSKAIAKRADAERERRSRLIHAEGESQASQWLADAGGVIALNPMVLQLRYFQTLTEISVEINSTIIFPILLEWFEPILNGKKEKIGK